MKKLTDEYVAKKLGWKQERPGLWTRWDRRTESERSSPPMYTTSLDAIVSEIEARGLRYRIGNGGKDCAASVFEPGGFALGPGHWDYVHALTAPLALCQALINYLDTQNNKVERK